MDDKELNRIVDAWITAQGAKKNLKERERNNWAVDLVIDWKYDKKPDLLWRFILTAYRRDLKDDVISILAASPLEDLIAFFGGQYINQIEELAQKDPKFKNLLGGVWPNKTPEDIWKRIEKVRLKK